MEKDIRKRLFGKSRKSKKHHRKSNKKLKVSEKLYKIVVLAGLAIAYKGLKGWLRNKRRRIKTKKCF